MFMEITAVTKENQKKTKIELSPLCDMRSPRNLAFCWRRSVAFRTESGYQLEETARSSQENRDLSDSG